MSNDTKFYINCSFKKGIPAEVISILSALFARDNCLIGERSLHRDLPDHPFFLTENWRTLGAWNGPGYLSQLWYDQDDEKHHLVSSTCIPGKAEDSEVKLFFDWIKPYIDAAEGDFIGYSMQYNLTDAPTFWYYSSEKYYSQDGKFGSPSSLIEEDTDRLKDHTFSETKALYLSKNSNVKSAEQNRHEEAKNNPIFDFKPWLTEPDELSWVDEETGLNCYIKRVLKEKKGHLAAYVEIPRDHILFGKEYAHQCCFPDFDVHMGITFSGPSYWTSLEESWWIGFDAGHFDEDYIPEYKEQRVTPKDYRNLEYMKNECKKLAKQIAEYGKQDINCNKIDSLENRIDQLDKKFYRLIDKLDLKYNTTMGFFY